MKIRNDDMRMNKLTWRAWLAVVMLSLLSVGLTACGGGSGNASGDNGQVVVGLTDAQGDFINYTVTVTSIELTRANGSTVETLPLNTEVDFSQYTDVTEFLTAATVPLGRYTSGTMTLDFTNADIWVEDANGDPLKVSEILDSNGDPVSTLNVTFQTDRNNFLVVAPGLLRHLVLDFDLAQSNQVRFYDDDNDPATPDIASVTVDPVLIADVDKTAPKQQRLRGALKAVDVAQSRYQVYIRPFFKRMSRSSDFGDFAIYVDNNTTYQIDGIPYQGAPGLEALAALNSGSATVALGKVKYNPLRFEAQEVRAGSSVAGGTLDVVKGSVTRREGDVLYINGASLMREDGSFEFHSGIAVQLADSTTVTRQFNSDPIGTFDKNDVSVGQRVVVFGTMTDMSGEPKQMDASNGYVQMRLSAVRGSITALAGSANYLTLDLDAINGRNPSIYDFTGTGDGTSGENAVPSAYEVDQGSLSGDALRLQDEIQVRGFVTPFGTAPADFAAQTLVELTAPAN
jgi:hypothetical protein